MYIGALYIEYMHPGFLIHGVLLCLIIFKRRETIFSFALISVENEGMRKLFEYI